MEFTIEMLVPCLEELGVEVATREAASSIAARRSFSYATTVTPEQQSAATADIAAIAPESAALAILPLDTTLELAPETLAASSVLVVATRQQRRDALSRNSTNAAAQQLPIAVTDLSPAAVCDAINAYLARIREWDAAMADVVIRGRSTQELLDLSEPVIGSYIALTDALYSAVAITPSFPPLDEISRSLVETGACSPAFFKRVEELASEQQWQTQTGSRLDQGGNSLNPYPNMSHIYRLNGNYAAHLVMVRPVPIEPWRQILFEILASRVGQCLNRFWSTTASDQGADASFLAAIIEDCIHDEGYFTERARICGYPLTGVFEIAAISDAEERGGIAHITHQIKLGVPESHTAVIGQVIYVLLVASEREAGKIAALEAKLFEMVERLHSRAGVSSRFDELANCHMARLEADVALKYGHKNHTKYLALKSREPYLDCVFRFNRYFPCYLVDPYSDTAEFMAKYAKSPNVINRLRQADRDNGSNDFWVLKTYLYYDCSIKRTAELMNMHRNTVIYRLDKIRREYHIDLDDSDTRLFLHYLFDVLD